MKYSRYTKVEKHSHCVLIQFESQRKKLASLLENMGKPLDVVSRQQGFFSYHSGWASRAEAESFTLRCAVFGHWIEHVQLSCSLRYAYFNDKNSFKHLNMRSTSMKHHFVWYSVHLVFIRLNRIDKHFSKHKVRQ